MHNCDNILIVRTIRQTDRLDSSPMFHVKHFVLCQFFTQFMQYNTSYYIVIFAQKSFAFFVHFLIYYFLKKY